MPTWEENKPATLAMIALSVFGVLFLSAKAELASREARQVGRPVPMEHTITIDGTGKALGKPDVAAVSFGVDTRGAEVASTQQKNTDAMNALLEKVKALGVSEDDIQTSNYSVYQDFRYDPNSGASIPTGWIVSQQVTIKMRDTAKISSVLQTVGQNGATNISGPNFTIDDPSSLLDEARADALEDANRKAMQLAQTLGLRIERIVGYSEYAPGGGPIPYYERAVGMGGGGAPSIAPGQNEVDLNVSITYKLVD